MTDAERLSLKELSVLRAKELVTGGGEISKPGYVKVTVKRRWYQKIYLRKKKMLSKLNEAYQSRRVVGMIVEVEVT